MKAVAIVLGVVLVAGLLFVLCVPALPNAKLPAAREGATKGNLGALRMALMLYVDEHGKKCPDSIDALSPRYIESIPKETVTGSNVVAGLFDGKGGWFFDSKKCQISVNLAGNDRHGTPYSKW